MRKGLIFGLWLLLLGCTFPQDPRLTTERVQNHIMHVGVSENEPWVIHQDDGTPTGVEVDLVKTFADQMNADIEWHWGGMSEHLEALNQFELDLAIGGLTTSAPGTSAVGITQPYFETAVVIGVPAGIPSPQSLSDASIGVIRGTAVADYVRRQDAEPLFLSEEESIDMPVAVPHWRLDDLNLDRTEHSLHTLKHVMAVPPGENRWLTELEKFLFEQPPIEP